jgi:hypothetical protein
MTGPFFRKHTERFPPVLFEIKKFIEHICNIKDENKTSDIVALILTFSMISRY